MLTSSPRSESAEPEGVRPSAGCVEISAAMASATRLAIVMPDPAMSTLIPRRGTLRRGELLVESADDDEPASTAEPARRREAEGRRLGDGETRRTPADRMPVGDSGGPPVADGLRMDGSDGSDVFEWANVVGRPCPSADASDRRPRGCSSSSDRIVLSVLADVESGPWPKLEPELAEPTEPTEIAGAPPEPAPWSTAVASDDDDANESLLSID